MTGFKQHKGIAVPLLRNDIDTDAIIPSDEMKSVSRHGLAEGLFARWRYTRSTVRMQNSEFVLNSAKYTGASILMAGPNFGCGSSREHAVWALSEYGFRAILAPSFGSIFRRNCIFNGLVPVVLAANDIKTLAAAVEPDPQTNKLTIDLDSKEVLGPDGLVFGFSMSEIELEIMRKGLDPIELTLQLDDVITAFHLADRRLRPWVY